MSTVDCEMLLSETNGFSTINVCIKRCGRLASSVTGDGQVKFNNNTYTMTSGDAVSVFLDVIRNHGISNAGISNGTTTQSFRNILYAEASQGARNWDGKYNYDPDATWNNGSKDLNGV